MNITHSAPPETIRIVRELAKKENTSLNQYVRDCLAAKAKEAEEQHKRECEEFHNLCDTRPPSRLSLASIANRKESGEEWRKP